MRVLVIGSGAREHALCYALNQSKQISYLACLPGNGGTRDIAENIPLDPMQFYECATWAMEQRIDLVIVGPDDPLAKGIVDVFQKYGLRCLGPTEAAARIESSKVWAKEFMQRHRIPTASAHVVTGKTLEKALQHIRGQQSSFPVAIKADGLAAGKGTIIAEHPGKAADALISMIKDRSFGEAGERVLVETFMTGHEVSVFALCDGASYRILGTACDYKRAYDNDQGPNTGGMGAYAPAYWLSPEELAKIEDEIIAPTVAGMAAEGYPFTGFLYAGLMITPGEGPRVVEFNARFGDPEAQVVLPLLDSSFLDLCLAATEGRLADQPPIQWRAGAACGVVLAAESYPAAGSKGALITGLDTVDAAALVFQAGTRRAGDQLVTNGGRILTVVGLGQDRVAAHDRAYANIARIMAPGTRYRRDIGAR